MKRLLLLATLSGIVTGAAAQTFDTTKADSLLARLERHHKAMGAVAIYKNGQPVYERAIGYAVTEKDVPNTPETVFKIGSVSKVFTAALIFKLIEEKKLTLDDKLDKWFPKMPNAANITIGQMLSHRSGLHNYTEAIDFSEWTKKPRTQADMLARLEGEQPDFEPGAKTEYSNTNFLLLGYVIEKVAGKDYCEVLRQKITKPLGLTHTDCAWPKTEKMPETRGYSWNGEQWEAAPPTPWFASAAAGGIYSNLQDLNSFIIALLQGKVVSQLSLSKMKEVKDGMGYGLHKIPFYNLYAFGHGGFIDNFNSTVAYFPKDSMSFAVAMNAANTNFNDILIGLLSIYYNKKYELPEFDKEVSVPVEILQQYVGVYRYAPIDMDIAVQLKGTQLTAQATGQDAFPLTAQTNTSFAFEAAGIVIDFQKIENGKAQLLMLHQGGSNIPFERK